jgi:hypothetical protein
MTSVSPHLSKNVEIDTIYDESISWMNASLASLLISAQEVL